MLCESPRLFLSFSQNFSLPHDSHTLSNEGPEKKKKVSFAYDFYTSLCYLHISYLIIFSPAGLPALLGQAEAGVWALLLRQIWHPEQGLFSSEDLPESNSCLPWHSKSLWVIKPGHQLTSHTVSKLPLVEFEREMSPVEHPVPSVCCSFGDTEDMRPG